VELLIQAARVAYASRPMSSLGPAEWMALRYFARANVQSRTPSALADFEASSRAAVSHIINRLEQDGYLLRHQSPEDARSVSIELTEKGVAAVRDDPIASLERAVRSLSECDQHGLHDCLREVLTHLAMFGVRRQFDVCRDCEFLEPRPGGNLKAEKEPAFTCNLLHVAIDVEATQLLCSHFRPSNVKTRPR
jgi:DNA-binding MarR family transcriptional regulator